MLSCSYFKMHLEWNSSSIFDKRIENLNVTLIIFTINNNIYIYIFQKDKIDNKFFRIKVKGNGSR